MKLEKLILENFLTYEQLEYDFKPYPIQIQGENLTDDNQKTNGSGKSGILTAIERAVTGANSRGVLDNELINFEKDKAKIELIAYCPIRKERLKITWSLTRKSSNKLLIKSKRDDESEYTDERTKFSDTNEGKKIISDWFAISKEDLFNYYFISKKRFKSFFKSTNEEKISLINRFSDASIIDGLDVSLDSDIKETEEEIKVLNDSIIEHNATIKEKESSLEYENNRDLSTEKEQIVQSIKEKVKGKESALKEANLSIEQLNQDNETILTEIDAANDALIDAENALKEYSKTDFEEKRKSIKEEVQEKEKSKKEKDKEKQEKDNSVDKASQIISNLNNQLAGAITCPNCSHKFSLEDENFDYEQAKQKKEQAENIKIKLNKAVSELNDTRTRIQAEIDSILLKRGEIDKLEEKEQEEIRELKKNANKASEKVEELTAKKAKNESKVTELKETVSLHKVSIKQLNEEINSIREPDNKERIKELKDQIKEYNKKIDAVNKEIEQQEEKLSEQKEWKHNFKRFRLHIANQSLEVMQYHTNKFLELMGSDLRVRFEGFKMLANGKTKEEISAKVIREGVERSFDSYSGGEQGRLLFASILANKYMIDSTHPYGGFDFTGIDEIFEGVDSMGLKYIMQSVADIKSSIMLITHVSDEELDSNTIKVVKEYGKSTIKYN